ncbi:MAG: hypothetical protein LBG65_03215 [Puniceicoccales bacterium]|nr:hypothetical protein [Puniceicoccales bacterium]
MEQIFMEFSFKIIQFQFILDILQKGEDRLANIGASPAIRSLCLDKNVEKNVLDALVYLKQEFLPDSFVNRKPGCEHGINKLPRFPVIPKE